MNSNILKADWLVKKHEIQKRLDEFSDLWKNISDERLFAELVFCLFTPQSKARSCWRAVEVLTEKKLLFKGTERQIAEIIGKCGVRFKNNKAKYLVNSRCFDIRQAIKEIPDVRLWLVKNIKGIGYKEASHFLRNIGFGDNIAILDRHILKNLTALGVIKQIPKTLDEKTYFEIERKMRAFSKRARIPMAHLDLLFWANEAGEIFK